MGFAFAGEKLLYQTFFMGLERVHFPGLGGKRLVHRTQALGDLLLFVSLNDRRSNGCHCNQVGLVADILTPYVLQLFEHRDQVFFELACRRGHFFAYTHQAATSQYLSELHIICSILGNGIRAVEVKRR